MIEQSENRESRPKSKQEIRSEEFIYKDAGIRERHGYVPAWLWVVVIALIAWGIYYTIAYWDAPPV